MKKLKGKCRKCVGCDKIFQKGFKGTKQCKYFIKKKIKQDYHIRPEKDKSFVIFALFEIFVIIIIMFGLYRFLMLSMGG